MRARLAGQAYEEYAARGTIHSMPAPAGLALTDPLPAPMFTPSTKAEAGHDREPLVRRGRAPSWAASSPSGCVRSASTIFEIAARRVADAGLVLADTKFELGLIDGELVLCDEVVTPDSSRLWPADGVVRGEAPPAFDKQPFRDWLAARCPGTARRHRRRCLTTSST